MAIAELRQISPAEFSTFVASLNARMTSAYSVRGAVIDNLLAVATWWTSLLWRTSHFEKELRNAEGLIADANERLFSPKGLRVLSPRDVALQFVSDLRYTSCFHVKRADQLSWRSSGSAWHGAAWLSLLSSRYY